MPKKSTFKSVYYASTGLVCEIRFPRPFECIPTQEVAHQWASKAVRASVVEQRATADKQPHPSTPGRCPSSGTGDGGTGGREGGLKCPRETPTVRMSEKLNSRTAPLLGFRPVCPPVREIKQQILSKRKDITSPPVPPYETHSLKEGKGREEGAL